jgi:hypothetical protein
MRKVVDVAVRNGGYVPAVCMPIANLVLLCFSYASCVCRINDSHCVVSGGRICDNILGRAAVCRLNFVHITVCAPVQTEP